MITTVLFDLDGVIRHFDPEVTADIERRHGVAAGELARVAFEPRLAGMLVTGRLPRADWVSAVGEAIGSAEAAMQWGAQQAHVDPDVLALAAEIRDRGIRTAILTNGTDTIAEETSALGLTGAFDPIFNSAEIGHAKPDARVFAHVIEALGCAPDEIFFIDDSATNVAGAVAAGLHAHRFTDAVDLRHALRAHLGD
ncbi:HAD family phosphatase [Microbacterium sp. KUDC0406]|uniref:HAD family hydrolase n=1 Tax=Microbacterium sp. KUDC0406 TaxID=2909588 RepID=UPI001F2F3563|nr:HAD family phosphatase [Microbacterium sp. KUDC0406]UJP11530.1 HAD family phosphatase [Microbacterium sp. KUDC0406]